jgi:hypothetical protein
MLLFKGELPAFNDDRDWLATCKAAFAAISNSVIFELANVE